MFAFKEGGAWFVAEWSWEERAERVVAGPFLEEGEAALAAVEREAALVAALPEEEDFEGWLSL